VLTLELQLPCCTVEKRGQPGPADLYCFLKQCTRKLASRYISTAIGGKASSLRPANHQTTTCQRTACWSAGGACHMGDRGSCAPMLQGSLMGSSQGRGEYSDLLCSCGQNALLVMLSDVLHACPYCGMCSSDIMLKACFSKCRCECVSACHRALQRLV
jgi:hypothetical protein